MILFFVPLLSFADSLPIQIRSDTSTITVAATKGKEANVFRPMSAAARPCFDSLVYDFDGFAKGYDYRQILARIKCPVLFIRGETKLGAMMTDEEISLLRRSFSTISFAQIDGVGHLLHMQDQGQAPMLAEMMRFLERIPK